MEKLKKKYVFLIVIVTLGIITGILFSNILSTEDSRLVTNKITEYFNNIKDDVPIDYLTNLITSLKNNLLYIGVIWILGLSVIGLLFNNFILFFKSFILGFSIGSIINIYLYRGIVLSFLYVFPSFLINIIVFLIMTSFANDFSLCLFNLLFKKKETKVKTLVKHYYKVLLYLSIILIISSLLETFVMPFVIKLFSFLIK